MGARGLQFSMISILGLATVAAGLGLSAEAQGRKKQVLNAEFDQMMFEEPMPQGIGFGVGVASFRMEQLPLGSAQPPTSSPHAGSHGGTIAVDSHGVLTLDRELGQLVRSDREGQVRARFDLQAGAGELVHNPAESVVYVADRRANRVLRLRAGADSFERLDGAALLEPHGLALSPDGSVLYATSVANHELVAFDTATMMPRWRLPLAHEPRGVAVSADGSEAMLGFLTSGLLARVSLGSSPNIDYVSLDPAQALEADPFGGRGGFGFGRGGEVRVTGALNNTDGLPSLADTKDVGLRFARNTYAVAYIGDGLAVAPHQLSTPHVPSAGFEDTGTYGGGGGFLAPILHRMAMISSEDTLAPSLVFAEIGVHQPRALAYDGPSDTLFVAGYGNDQIMAIAHVSQSSIYHEWTTTVGSEAGACAPDGLAVDGGLLFVHCELDRSLQRIDLSRADAGTLFAQRLVELGPSPRSAEAQRGAELFRRGQDGRISVGGFMACASCHPEGRTDGLSWRIEGHNLQTPLLSGRLMGTHPFKWDGKDKDLPTSLGNTVGRLGGSGLSPSDVEDLQAFLTSLPAPVAPSATDPSALARGKALFESDESACGACHEGTQLADGVQHELNTNIGKVDTPSLIGLAHSAPYYHDGSAQTLYALLTDRGSIHDMGSTAHLDAEQIDDLITYLESL